MLRVTTLLLWVLTAASSLAVAQVAPTSAPSWPILVVRVEFDGSSHTVKDARVVQSPVPLQSGGDASGVERLHFAVTNSVGAVLASGEQDDPRILRSPLSEPGQPFEGHHTFVQDKADYYIRVPYEDGMRYLELGAARANEAGSRQKTTPSKVVDLAPFLER